MTTQHASLVVRPKEAAKLLWVCQRTLWEWTYPRGTLPVIKTKRAVLYRRADLEAWLAKQVQGTTEGQADDAH